MRIKKRPKVLKSGVFVYKSVYIVCKCLIIKRDCGERGSTTNHFTKYQNIAKPRKTWIPGFCVICYCVTKYHFSGQIRVQNRVQWFLGHFRTTFH